jgi:hypothetical protein
LVADSTCGILVIADVFPGAVQVTKAPEIRVPCFWMVVVVAPAVVTLEQVGNAGDRPFMVAGNPVIMERVDGALFPRERW